MYFTLYNLLRQGQELCAKNPSCLEAMNPWKNIHFLRTVSHHNSLLNTLSWLWTKIHSILTKPTIPVSVCLSKKVKHICFVK